MALTDPPLDSPSSPILSSSPNPNKFNKLRLISILMGLLFLALISLLTFFAVSGASRRQLSDNRPPDIIIRDVCKASRDPPTCQSSLSFSNRVTAGATISQAVLSAVSVNSQNLETGRKMVQDVLDEAAGNQTRSDMAKTCLEFLGYSAYRLNLVADALPRGKIGDARAWMSAAMAYQYGCHAGLKTVNHTRLVIDTVAFFNYSLVPSSMDALAMMANYDYFGEVTESWAPPKTERDGFWKESSCSTLHGGVPPGLKENVTVCGGGGGCDYERVQEAVNAAPDNPGPGIRFVIWIKTGVYEETVRIPLEKRNVVFLGDGMGKTVIRGSMNFGLQKINTYNTATVGVTGDGFMASNLTIQNTAEAGANQAVAFRSDSDLSIIENCEFIGNQDTLYAHSLRQYYKSCRIQGNIDFIFGQSAAFFQDCLILVAPRQSEPEKGDNSAVTAHGRIDPAQATGFVFQNCVINGTDSYMALYSKNPSVHKTYLGRPWKEFSRTVFINCTLEALIMPDGWMPWSGDFALKTLYYGEFENTGPGSLTAARVNWSSLIPADHVCSFSLQNFIQGDQWVLTSS